MKIDIGRFKKVHGYEEGKDVLDSASLNKAADYKKNVLKNFTAIDQNQITERFRDGEYFVSRKYDGGLPLSFIRTGRRLRSTARDVPAAVFPASMRPES
ncbi:MAG: hypothetical protein LIO77_09355 [Rikenellaceae bacterium]|nr:hypothetical protein [Rikenellaceae bacterium]